MRLTCIRPFGNFEPDDEVEVPDGAVFDRYYFEEADLASPPAPAPEPLAQEEGN